MLMNVRDLIISGSLWKMIVDGNLNQRRSVFE
jgi:hypothetical protein